MPLLGPKEKGELETLVYGQLVEYWNAHGSSVLLAPGTSIVLERMKRLDGHRMPPLGRLVVDQQGVQKSNATMEACKAVIK